ncbi:MAG: stage II sporulation protein D [Acutalibacteraceae bacterium]|nr:stage II sporulation protein D [Acutalibacteraceae bacterium]
MQTNLIVSIIVALSLVLCPVAALTGGETKTVATVTEDAVYGYENDTISVMSSSDGKINNIDMREYLTGCVAAEMPANYHTEALKAQAVASYTYAKKTLEKNKKEKNSVLGGADISDSPDTHQGYINQDVRKEKWGEKYEEYEKKISAAVDEVYGSFLTYNGETALAVYHSISAGSTQSAESLWNVEIPYLISVESVGDKLSPDYISVNKFSGNEFEKLCKKCGANTDKSEKNLVEKTEKDDDGYVLSVTVAGKEIAATKFREVFSLKSNCFEIEYDNGEYTITCKGHGHGAGMSQYGADYMARQGFSWREILNHYYPGTDISCENG